MEPYRELALTKGQFAIVDACDYDWLNQWQWSASWCPDLQDFYAMRSIRINGHQQSIRMHRLILGLTASDKQHVDHINHKTLDNRRSNLRLATISQNMCNAKVRESNLTGYKGVYLHRGKFMARLTVNKKTTFLGYHLSPELAALAYDEAAKRHHGEFAVLNFPA